MEGLKAVPNETIGPSAGSMRSDGTSGTQRADLGPLTINANLYNNGALLNGRVTSIADRTGEKGQPAGSGGDAGEGEEEVHEAGSHVETLASVVDNRFTLRGLRHIYNGN